MFHKEVSWGRYFFSFFFNDLPSYLNQDLDCYADDSTLEVSADNIDDINSLLTQDCVKVEEWMSFNKLKLNAEKTNVMLMGTSARLSTLETPLEVELAGIKLKQNESRSETLLGVKIQSNLKWSEQIKCLGSKLQIRLAGLEKLKYVMNRQKRKTIVQ